MDTLYYFFPGLPRARVSVCVKDIFSRPYGVGSFGVRPDTILSPGNAHCAGRLPPKRKKVQHPA